MKKILSYGFVIAILAFCSVDVGTGINTEEGEISNIDSGHAVSFFHTTSNASQSEQFFIASDVSANNFLSRIHTPRILTSIVKIGNQNNFCKLNLVFSQLIHRRLHTVKSVFVALCSQKEKDGYYLYTLCRLRI